MTGAILTGIGAGGTIADLIGIVGQIDKTIPADWNIGAPKGGLPLPPKSIGTTNPNAKTVGDLINAVGARPRTDNSLQPGKPIDQMTDAELDAEADRQNALSQSNAETAAAGGVQNFWAKQGVNIVLILFLLIAVYVLLNGTSVQNAVAGGVKNARKGIGLD